MDKVGNVYVADTYNKRIQKFTAQGEFLLEFKAQGKPWGIAVDDRGFTYAVYPDDHSVQKFSPDGAFVDRWGSQGSDPGYFMNPFDITIGLDGIVYVTDTFNYRIQKFSTDGKLLGQIYARSPRAVALDSQGNIYTVDGEWHRVQKFSPLGKEITTWGEKGNGVGKFDFPTGITVDDSGSVYVDDYDNHRIQRFDLNGKYLATWGRFGSDDGQIRYSRAIAAAPGGVLYVADGNNDRIQVFGPSTTARFVVAEPAATALPPQPSNFVMNFGNRGAANGEFHFPRGVAVSPDGFVYVADTFNRRVQKFTSGGAFVTSWSTPGQPWAASASADSVYVALPLEGRVWSGIRRMEHCFAPGGAPATEIVSSTTRSGSLLMALETSWLRTRSITTSRCSRLTGTFLGSSAALAAHRAR